MSFGNVGGINILETLERYGKILDKHEKELELLRPYGIQMALIRGVVLEKLSGAQTFYNVRLERNAVAHGGQIITDIKIIDEELDLERKRIWRQGFRNLYGVDFKYAVDIVHDRTITAITNIHADASTLDVCKNQNVVNRAGDLIELWCDWADNRTQIYPFRDPACERMLNGFLRSVL